LDERVFDEFARCFPSASETVWSETVWSKVVSV